MKTRIYIYNSQVVFVFAFVGVCLSAAPGWSIWKNGMWEIPDDDMDNIPGKINFIFRVN